LRWNRKQEEVIQKAVYHVRHGNNQVYEYSGYPGTGKTAVLMEIIRRIGIPLHRIAPMAFIGQAAIVMRSRGLMNAKTCHSWCFELVDEILVDANGRTIIDSTFNQPRKELVFRPKTKEDFRDIDYFIIDEAFTVPIEMKSIIEGFGKKIIACGDWGQLPPVKSKPAYLTDKEHTDCLEEIMRQDANAGIAYVSKMVREGIPLSPGYYGNCIVIEQKDLTLDMIKHSQIIICGKNKTREKYIDLVRHDILHAKTILPGYGEKLICRKNNWGLEVDGISLANGLIGRVSTPPDVTRFDYKSFDIDFTTDLMDIRFENLACDYEYFTANYEQRQLLKNNKYNDANKFEYAYAITTHLSQGAQYRNGIYIQENFPDDIQANLNHVGASRFQNFLIYVIPDRPRRFFF
jgi:ATP-dependent exoDNAse (exonuclease V) alpha subunit